MADKPSGRAKKVRDRMIFTSEIKLFNPNFAKYFAQIDPNLMLKSYSYIFKAKV